MKTGNKKGTVHCVFGPQGAGKSTYSQSLVKQYKAVYFSIDQWMTELYASDSPEPLDFHWIMERVSRCECMIWKTAQSVANNGTDVILDLGFTKKESRKQFLALAEESGLMSQFYCINAPQAVRRARVLNRNKEKGETFSFEVTPMMFDFMEGIFETISDEERSYTQMVDTA